MTSTEFESFLMLFVMELVYLNALVKHQDSRSTKFPLRHQLHFLCDKPSFNFTVESITEYMKKNQSHFAQECVVTKISDEEYLLEADRAKARMKYQAPLGGFITDITDRFDEEKISNRYFKDLIDKLKP